MAQPVYPGEVVSVTVAPGVVVPYGVGVPGQGSAVISMFTTTELIYSDQIPVSYFLGGSVHPLAEATSLATQTSSATASTPTSVTSAASTASSAAPTSVSTNMPSSSGLSTGAIAGIAVACSAFAGLLAGFLVWFFLTRRHRRALNSNKLIEDEKAAVPLTPHDVTMQSDVTALDPPTFHPGFYKLRDSASSVQLTGSRSVADLNRETEGNYELDDVHEDQRL